MGVTIRDIARKDIAQATDIWNSVVVAGNAFPQIDPMTLDEAPRFLIDENHTRVAVNSDAVVGLYILHPNNLGRCGHVANASYAVSGDARGEGIGRMLVEDSLKQAASLGYRGMQFNAVVKSNEVAHHLYESIGFTRIGTIPGGFHNAQGAYEDMVIYFYPLA